MAVAAQNLREARLQVRPLARYRHDRLKIAQLVATVEAPTREPQFPGAGNAADATAKDGLSPLCPRAAEAPKTIIETSIKAKQAFR